VARPGEVGSGQGGKVMDRIGSSRRAVRAGRMVAFAAWAAADLADADPALDRDELARQLQQWADETGCFGGHPGRVMGAAYGATFDGEIARLRRTGEVAAWRAAKDKWASHDVPHHAAYASWRLAGAYWQPAGAGTPSPSSLRHTLLPRTTSPCGERSRVSPAAPGWPSPTPTRPRPPRRRS
jgi:hypothetical protein